MYKWATNEQFEGPFIYDKMNGKGNFYHANGKSVEVTFVNDARVS